MEEVAEPGKTVLMARTAALLVIPALPPIRHLPLRWQAREPRPDKEVVPHRTVAA
jgi:hypothetical protein